MQINLAVRLRRSDNFSYLSLSPTHFTSASILTCVTMTSSSNGGQRPVKISRQAQQPLSLLERIKVCRRSSKVQRLVSLVSNDSWTRAEDDWNERKHKGRQLHHVHYLDEQSNAINLTCKIASLHLFTMVHFSTPLQVTSSSRHDYSLIWWSISTTSSQDVSRRVITRMSIISASLFLTRVWPCRK